jgi:hypothetical protein
VVKISTTEWIEHCRRCSYATFFQTPFWAGLFSSSNAIVTRKLTFNDGVTVVLPLVCRSLLAGLVKVYISMPASTFGGWITSDTLTIEHCAILMNFNKKYRDFFWRENPYDKNLLKMDIPESHQDVTFCVDLEKGYEDILKRSEYSHRKAIKVAQRSRIEIARAETLSEWDQYFSMYQSSISRWKKRNVFSGVEYNCHLLHKIFSIDSQYRTLWIAYHNSKPVAGILCFYWNKHAVAWHGAGLEEYFKLRPNNLLYSVAIKDACTKGYSWFDCNPSGGLKGVIKFKKGLGAIELQSRYINRKSLMRYIVDYIRRITK